MPRSPSKRCQLSQVALTGFSYISLPLLLPLALPLATTAQLLLPPPPPVTTLDGPPLLPVPQPPGPGYRSPARVGVPATSQRSTNLQMFRVQAQCHPYSGTQGVVINGGYACLPRSRSFDRGLTPASMVMPWDRQAGCATYPGTRVLWLNNGNGFICVAK